jgi:hypothetical protein
MRLSQSHHNIARFCVGDLLQILKQKKRDEEEHDNGRT